MIEGYQRHEINREVDRSCRTGRDDKFYRRVFGYGDGEILAGKKILDVGAGNSNFSDFAETKGGTVINLDPTYVEDPSGRSNKVPGFVQDIPFPDGAFDETIASYSLYWVKTGLDRALSEMVRVTKDGGTVKIYPTHLFEEKVFGGISCVSLSDYDPENLNLSAKTLTIKKYPEIRAEEWTGIVANILASVTFDTEAARLLSLGKIDSLDGCSSVKIPTYPIPVFKGNF